MFSLWQDLSVGTKNVVPVTLLSEKLNLCINFERKEKGLSYTLGYIARLWTNIFDPVTLTSNFDLLWKKLKFEPKDILRGYKSLGGVLIPQGQPGTVRFYMLRILPTPPRHLDLHLSIQVHEDIWFNVMINVPNIKCNDPSLLCNINNSTVFLFCVHVHIFTRSLNLCFNAARSILVLRDKYIYIYIYMSLCTVLNNTWKSYLNIFRTFRNVRKYWTKNKHKHCYI